MGSLIKGMVIIDDVLGLFALKLNKATVRFEWKNIKPACQQGENLLHTRGGEPGRTFQFLKAELADYINCNIPNFLNTEFDNIVAALVDFATPYSAVDVVRSTGFAVHPPPNKGYAFEDRAEIETAFPDLETTYERIKVIGNRY